MMTRLHRSLRRRLHAFFRGPAARAGNVAILFALGAPLIIAGGALGVETTYWSFKSLHLQDAADAAAHAAALEQRSGSNTATVTAVATDTATKNGFDPTTETITVNSPPTSGPHAGGQAVEVILHAPVQRMMTAMFMPKDLVLKARAVASFNAASTACVLALNATAGKAALISGNTTVTLNGCSVMANSSAANAIVQQGSSQITTDCLITVGGVQVAGGLTETKCPSPVTGAPAVGDPFKGLTQPLASGACLNGSGGNLQPGYYCGGLTLKNNVNLNPGVYYLAGNLTVNAGANVTGSGVTIFLASGAHVSINGNSTVNLSAPTSGMYAGMLLWGDRNGLAGSDTINGTAASKLTGAIYFPKDAVSYLGNFSGTNGCTQVVADTVQWSGNTTVSGDCTALGMTPIPALSIVKLTE